MLYSGPNNEGWSLGRADAESYLLLINLQDPFSSS